SQKLGLVVAALAGDGSNVGAGAQIQSAANGN
ncbi:MAG: hypothetical protein ACI82H_001029, partial [Alphaproteobacteria bacterium]